MEKTDRSNHQVIFYASNPQASGKLLDVLKTGLGKMNFGFSHSSFKDSEKKTCSLALILLGKEESLSHFKEHLNQILPGAQKSLAIVDSKRKKIFEDEFKNFPITEVLFFPINSNSLLQTIGNLLQKNSAKTGPAPKTASALSTPAPPPPIPQETEGIAAMFNSIITQAIREKASDIHLESHTSGLTLKFRVDGELRKILSPPKSTHKSLVEHIKTSASLNLSEKRLPQEGSCHLRILNMDIQLRISSVPTIQFEKMVISILKKEEFKVDISQLGIPRESLELIKKYLHSPYGLIVVSGPIRSGKSTSLYAMIQEVFSESKNIVSVENVIEFQLPGMTQLKLDPDRGFTADVAMEHVLFQDPDIVMIDPIRDHRTADSAVKFSLTGHQILAGVSASSILHTFSQLRDFNVSPLTLGSALTLVIFQKLVKKICPHCKEQTHIPEEMLSQLPPELQKNPFSYVGRGCSHCGQSGYLGQTGVFEVLPVGKNIRQLLYKNRPLEELQKILEESRWRDIKALAFDLVQKGVTTLEQAISLHG